VDEKVVRVGQIVRAELDEAESNEGDEKEENEVVCGGIKFKEVESNEDGEELDENESNEGGEEKEEKEENEVVQEEKVV
jgi:hypothetical protein